MLRYLVFAVCDSVYPGHIIAESVCLCVFARAQRPTTDTTAVGMTWSIPGRPPTHAQTLLPSPVPFNE